MTTTAPTEPDVETRPDSGPDPDPTPTPEAPAPDSPPVEQAVPDVEPPPPHVAVTFEIPKLVPPTLTFDRVAKLKVPELKIVLDHFTFGYPASARKEHLQAMVRNVFRLEELDRREKLAAAAGIETETVESETLQPLSEDRHVVPTPSRWQTIQSMAVSLSDSALVPEVLRKKPQDVAVILLAANDLGIPLTQALTKLYVIKGKVGQEAELMRALIFRDGHEIGVKTETPTSCTVYGRRKDTGQYEEASFTLEEAKVAGLIRSYDDTGKVVAADKKDVWRSFTVDMLFARATARLARRLFGDCLGGVSYTPDELGYIEAEPADQGPRGRAGETEPTVTIKQQRDNLAARIQELDEDLRTECIDQWRRRNLGRIENLTPGALRSGSNLVAEFEKRQEARQVDAEGDIDDAETVPEAAVVEDGPDEQPPGAAAAVEGDDALARPFTEASPDAPCSMCGSVRAERAAGADGAVRCLDSTACIGRVERAAKAAVETPAALEAGPNAAEVCGEPGCDETATGMGKCPLHGGPM